MEAAEQTCDFVMRAAFQKKSPVKLHLLTVIVPPEVLEQSLFLFWPSKGRSVKRLKQKEASLFLPTLLHGAKKYCEFFFFCFFCRVCVQSKRVQENKYIVCPFKYLQRKCISRTCTLVCTNGNLQRSHRCGADVEENAWKREARSSTEISGLIFYNALGGRCSYGQKKKKLKNSSALFTTHLMKSLVFLFPGWVGSQAAQTDQTRPRPQVASISGRRSRKQLSSPPL